VIFNLLTNLEPSYIRIKFWYPDKAAMYLTYRLRTKYFLVSWCQSARIFWSSITRHCLQDSLGGNSRTVMIGNYYYWKLIHRYKCFSVFMFPLEFNPLKIWSVHVLQFISFQLKRAYSMEKYFSFSINVWASC